jgi:hypothetical protein
MLLCLGKLVVTMANFNEQQNGSLVRRSSTHRLFSTPIVSGHDSDSVVQNVVTPVTQAAMDSLMRPALQTLITPLGIETPRGESYTHVSMLVFVVLFCYIWKRMSCWPFCCNDSGSIGS